jgi:hypothetical protein
MVLVPAKPRKAPPAHGFAQEDMDRRTRAWIEAPAFSPKKERAGAADYISPGVRDFSSPLLGLPVKSGDIVRVQMQALAQLR